MIRLVLILCIMVLSACDKPRAPIVDHSPSPSINPKYLYTVASGDSLYSIAFITNTDVNTLAQINQIDDVHTIYVGQVLALRAEVAETLRQNKVKKAQTNAPDSAPAPTSTPAPQKPRVTASKPRQAPIPQPDKSVAKSDKGWIWPVQGKIVRGYSATSKGIDIGGNSGTPIKASKSGVVVYTGDAIRGSGNMVIVKHSERYLSAYAHLKSIGVSEGQQVRQGQAIGTMGRTDTTSDRLHFEIRDKGKPLNPLTVLKR